MAWRRQWQLTPYIREGDVDLKDLNKLVPHQSFPTTLTPPLLLNRSKQLTVQL